MAVVSELITEFKFSGSEAPLTKYNAALGKGIGLLAGMTAALAASGVALAKWTTGVLAGEQSLINLASQTGVAVERIQELRYIAEVSNSDIGALDQSLLELSKTIGEAAQKGSEDFSRLGISVRDMSGQVKSADQVLSEISQRFRSMNLARAEQQSFAQTLGIEPSLITMMNRTSGEMAELSARARELGVLTQEQTTFAMEYNDAMTTMRFAMDGVRRLVAVGLGPELKAMAEDFTDLLTENKDWIVSGLQAAIGVLSDFMEMIGRVWPLLVTGAALFVGLKVATLGWAGALGILFSPAILIAAAIAGVLLIVDDLIVAFQGGKSVIREFFMEMFGYDIQPVLQAIVQGFTEAFNKVLDIGQAFITSVGAIFSGIGNLLTGNFEEALEDFKRWFTIWVDTLSDLVPDWIKNFFAGDTPGATGGAPSPGGGGGNSFLPGGTQALPGVSQSTNQEVTQNIYTSDPVRAGQVAADNLQRQMDDAQTQYNRGGM
jgi:hypothetical protein